MGTSREALAKSAAQAAQIAARTQSEQDPRWPIVLRAVASPALVRSARLSQFLLYICERTILGLEDEINEQQVGIHVFDRPADYNSSEDNIVRTQARLLRKKLEEYYATDGRDEPIRIEIPKGAYVPTFREPVVIEESPATTPPSRLEPLKARTLGRRQIAAAIVLGALCLAGGLGYWRYAQQSPGYRARKFWSQMFGDIRPTVIVPSDTAFVLYQNYTGRTVGLNEYITREFWRHFETPANMAPWFITGLAPLPYTNIVDLNLSWSLSRNPMVDAKRAVIRPSRDLRMADLKGVNGVLIGARRANPWVELFDRDNTFQGLFDTVHRDHVLNRDPRNGELSVYREHQVNGVNHAYAVIAFTRGLTGQENVLLLSGTSTAGTEGAADFVLNERSLGGFLQKIAPGSGLIPHFELILDVENVELSSPRAEVVAYRIQEN